ncbi:hypothetical protein BJ973_005879 [Actinoplanes tereljensis]|uniref:Uncharacterized protein n=1 Tax=Paractinoplanes tereljensis TaxID=571912 RepID=A0A919NHN4_9ACTN|nr:hypothetical protein [Actinoplanes tereljensis]GIF18834.1 hypothetical protein Ate02nite_15640 [Actinoplanes tereljensis]
MRTGSRLLAAGLIALGAGVGAVAVLGPLLLGVLRYRISATSLNQIVGSDAAALVVVVPVTVAIGFWRSAVTRPLRCWPWRRPFSSSTPTPS